MELLVVMAIIMSMAAAAAPALSAFRKGQRLDHSGRLVTSAINDARRMAITKHARHVVVLYSYAEVAGEMDTVRHAIRIYQEPTGVKPAPGIAPDISKGYWPGGYVGEALVLPSGIRFKQEIMPVRKQEGLPDENGPLFVRQKRGERSNDVITFRRDGTIEDRLDESPTDASGGRNFFLPDEGCYQIPEAQRADFVLAETSPEGVELTQKGKKRRCLVDLNLGTGRALSRCFDVGQGFEYIPTGQQTPGG